MYTSSQLEAIKHNYRISIESNKPEIFEEFLARHQRLTTEVVVCDVLWTTIDIKDKRPQWTDEQLQEAAKQISKKLSDRCTDEGQEVLEYLLDDVTFKD